MRFRSIIAIAFLQMFIVHNNIFAQSKLSTELDIGYMTGLSERGSLFNISRMECNMYAKSIRLSTNYHCSAPISVGMGVGLERYETPGYNTLSVLAILKYSPLKKLPSSFIYSDVGYSIPFSNFTNGMLIDFGFGHRWRLQKHIGLKVQMGYNLKQFKLDKSGDSQCTNKVNQWRHSLMLSTGIVF